MKPTITAIAGTAITRRRQGLWWVVEAADCKLPE